MGISFSCPFRQWSDILESVVVKSMNSGDENCITPVRTVSLKSLTISEALRSGKMMVEEEESVSFGRKFQLETVESPKETRISDLLPVLDPSNPKHEAAIKLQKVYKSFRTRRKLADCAVIVEQSWWKLLDFAELKRSSISFFDIEKHETAISRWSRARTRAAKVGKGLSKNDKAQKLALQHWLEAIDPRHRYGHNLHFYYAKWLNSQSREPFFYWLDIGEGKEILVEKCPRPKLQQQCIKYLGPMERKVYEVVLIDGRFVHKQTGEFVDMTGEDKDAKWIFVLSTSKIMYIGKKKKGTFQHSSFLAGGATIAAGRLVVENGLIKAVWPHSGHYQPTEENFKDFILFLQENDIDLKDVKMNPVDDEEVSFNKLRSSNHLRNHSSEEDFTETLEFVETNEIILEDIQKSPATPKCGEVSFERVDSEYRSVEPRHKKISGTEENNWVPKEEEKNQVVKIREESILRRINSKKGTKSFQLGKQLSCKWTTGAGPRIGCVRDYPSELQFQALEQVNLSPRSAAISRSEFNIRNSTGMSPRDSEEEMTPKQSFSIQNKIQRIRTQASLLLRGTSLPAIMMNS